jgi:uncharacterized membrane protein
MVSQVIFHLMVRWRQNCFRFLYPYVTHEVARKYAEILKEHGYKYDKCLYVPLLLDVIDHLSRVVKMLTQDDVQDHGG